MKLMDLIHTARSRGASDVHIVAGLPPALRVNGEIIIAPGEVLGRSQIRQFVEDILNAAQKHQLESQKELCFSLYEEGAGRTRVTVYYHSGSPELSLRLCSLQIPDSETLGLPRIVDEFALKSNGLILIAGATGAGKTTTLNYMVDRINHERRCKIVMIEDPVEFVHRPDKSVIVQQEIYTDTLSFPRALVHGLRQNPDVIVIGEMRELDAISTALTAAETGHLVMATLHTPNTVQTVERITAVFPADQQNQIRLQLANALQGIIMQTLLPRADGKGRVLAHELMIASSAVRSAIRDNKLHMLYSILQTGRKEGMTTLDQCLEDLYHKAVITYDVAVSHAQYPNSFGRSGKAAGGAVMTPIPRRIDDGAQI